MIKTDKYCFDITIGVEGSTRGVQKNFLKQHDLLAFKFLVTSGAAVPYVTCSLRLTNKQLVNYFKEESEIYVSFGPTENRMETFKIVPGTINTTQGEPGSQEVVVSFEAVIDVASSKFLLNTDTRALNGTSLDVLKTLSKEFFGKELDTNITEVNEQPMTWRQDSDLNSTFFANVWLHMNIAPDVPLLYIDKNLQMHLLSLEDIKKSEPVAVLTPGKVQEGKNQVHFINEFLPQQYRNIANVNTSNQIVGVFDADTGKINVKFPETDKPILAATKDVEKSKTGYSTKENRWESANVFKGYKFAYQFNRAKLISLSSIFSWADIPGYQTRFKIYDKVEVIGVSPEHTGMYIISDIDYTLAHGSGFITTLWLVRDNINHVEKYVLKKDENNAFLKFKSEVQKMYSLVRNLRKYVQMARYVIDGSLHRDLIKFVTRMKGELLRSFTVAGISLDFNDMDQLVNSLKSIGNNLLNKIIATYLPAPFNTSLQNFILQNPTLRGLLSTLLTRHAPEDVRILIVEITGLLSDITAGLDRLAKDANNEQKKDNINSGNKDVGFKDTPSGVTDVTVKDKDEVDKDKDTDEKVKDIVDDILDNTKDVDIPIPVISLDESQKLLSDKALRNLIADQILMDLSGKGYLEGITDFKDILLGNKAMDFATINTLNKNVGTILYSRYWGVFNKPEELTDFYITDQFRDKYKAPEFTRLVCAKKNQRIFVAFPKFEQDLRVLINSKFEDMEIVEDVDLGVRDKNDFPVLYNLYLSPRGYNSNSNILEVRRGV